MSAQSDPLPPEPPALLKQIKWFMVYGIRYKAVLAIALCVVVITYVVMATGIDKDIIRVISNWVACLNPDEMARPLSCGL